MILHIVDQTSEWTEQSREAILAQLGLPVATYYRWLARAEEDRLDDQPVLPDRRLPRATPAECQAVRHFALAWPQTGYKRLAWQMVDEDVAYLRPWQVLQILREQDLLRRPPAGAPAALKRPPEPTRPDQRWHVDLMYLHVPPRWFYLVDILDAYSRYLVHWTLNPTMREETVTQTLQEAFERLPPEVACQVEVVHDHGSQFIGTEWRQVAEAIGFQDIPTRVAHPQSNGRLERLHRTHREEGIPPEGVEDYLSALDRLEAWAEFYNHRRPHSALQYLRPVDYYRGDPEARLAERRAKLAQGLRERHTYWEVDSRPVEPESLT